MAESYVNSQYFNSQWLLNNFWRELMYFTISAPIGVISLPTWKIMTDKSNMRVYREVTLQLRVVPTLKYLLSSFLSQIYSTVFFHIKSDCLFSISFIRIHSYLFPRPRTFSFTPWMRFLLLFLLIGEQRNTQAGVKPVGWHLKVSSKLTQSS